MVPPEVILDRFVRTEFCHQPGFSGYISKLDFETVESPSLRSFLYLVQEAMNEALRLEGVNASGGTEHPPFHFDFLDVNTSVANAHAFQHGGVAFIVVTLPMVELLWRLTYWLSRSPRVREELNLPLGVDMDAIQGLLLQIQLSFLVSHEYTHHVHEHCVDRNVGVNHIWTEFQREETGGTLHSQAQELDADGYAVYLRLEHLLRSERRESALTLLAGSDFQKLAGDGMLLTCFFLTLLAFYCSFWRGGIEISSIYEFRHPPPPVRIKYAFRVAEMWARQNESVPSSWFTPTRFQALLSLVAGVCSESVKKEWDAQIAFLRSPHGTQYDDQLFARFEAIRSNGRNDDPPTASL